jgi:hypothetical protein
MIDILELNIENLRRLRLILRSLKAISSNLMLLHCLALVFYEKFKSSDD